MNGLKTLKNKKHFYTNIYLADNFIVLNDSASPKIGMKMYLHFFKGIRAG